MKKLIALLLIFGFTFGFTFQMMTGEVQAEIKRKKCCDTTCTCGNGNSCTTQGEAGEPCETCVPADCYGTYYCVHTFIDCLAIPIPGQPH